MKKGNKESELTGVKEIARRAKVSIGTVDRVLHNRTGVSQKTKGVILGIIKEMDYQPNIFARRLASKKVLNFAILIPKISHETEFWNAPLSGIEQAEQEIKRYGITVEKFFFDQNDKATFVAQTKKILKGTTDGVLLAPSFIEESITFTQACKKSKIPFVLINSDIPNEDCLSYIGPDLYHSGYLSAHLFNYSMKRNSKVLIVNIAKEIDNEHYLIKKEEGFRAYFNDNIKKIDIIKTDILETDFLSVSKSLKNILAANDGIQGIFVTNSRVFSVARFLQEANIKKMFLIGFDFLNENIDYLKKGTIDFLICQKPQEQGYRGIMALYQHLIFNETVEKKYFMPIDIITKENYSFYRN